MLLVDGTEFAYRLPAHMFLHETSSIPCLSPLLAYQHLFGGVERGSSVIRVIHGTLRDCPRGSVVGVDDAGWSERHFCPGRDGLLRNHRRTRRFSLAEPRLIGADRLTLKASRRPV